MSVTNTLRGLDHAHTAYALVIDGCPSIFATHEDLEGAANVTGTWIYTDRALTSAAVTASLMIPKSLPMAIDLRDATIRDQTVSFDIMDLNDELASLFAATNDDVKRLKDTIKPTDSPVPATKLTVDLTSVFGKHVGTELIGSSGERRQNPCFLSGSSAFQVGMFHPGDNFGWGAPRVPVTDTPLIWTGRRYCLYRVYRDVINTKLTSGSATWRPLSESPIIHWGQLRDIGETRNRAWKLSAEGPASWLKKPLNQNTTAEPTAFLASASLTPEESEVGIDLFQKELAVPNTLLGFNQIDFGEFNFTRTVDGANAVAMFNSLEVIVNEARDALVAFGGTTAFNQWKGGDIKLIAGLRQFAIKVDDLADRNRYAGMRLCLHEKVWALIGYDPVQETLELDDIKRVHFKAVGSFNTVPTSTTGYFEALITTIPQGFAAELGGDDILQQGENLGQVDNQGEYRYVGPLYPAGAHYLDPTLNNGSGQIIFLNEMDEYKCEGQLVRPPASDPNNKTIAYNIPGVGDVDSTRIFLFHGPRRFLGSDDVFDEFQVAKCSWKDNNGYVAIDGEHLSPTLVVEEWLDPRLFGYDVDKLNSPWIGVQGAANNEDSRIKITPLAVWKYYKEEREKAYIIAQRILLGTGTSTGWVGGFEGHPFASIDEGDNNPSGGGNLHNGFFIKTDAEIADLSLGIPKEMVATPLAWSNEDAKIPEELDLVNMRVIGKRDSYELLQSLFQSRGWLWSLDNGKYGPMEILSPTDPADATVTIAAEDVVGNPDRPQSGWPKQAIRTLAPIDSVHLSHTFEPLENSTVKTFDMDSLDEGAFYRRGQVKHNITDIGLVAIGASNWRVAWMALWQQACDFWAQRHFKVSLRLHRIRGEQCWPGTRVLLTDPRLIAQSGIYGIESFSGVVISVNRKPSLEVTDVEILVHQANAKKFSLVGVVVKPKGYVPDDLKIFADDGFIGPPEPPPDQIKDLKVLTEPPWSMLGGNTIIEIYEQNYDINKSWSLLGTGSVASVNVDVDGQNFMILDEALSFKWLRDTDKLIVFAPAEKQTATWVRALMLPIGDENGMSSGTLASPFL